MTIRANAGPTPPRLAGLWAVAGVTSAAAAWALGYAAGGTHALSAALVAGTAALSCLTGVYAAVQGRSPRATLGHAALALAATLAMTLLRGGR